MNWAWANSLDQMWRSAAFPMWLTLAAAAFFAVIVVITLLRAEKSVANGALTVITLLAVGIALAATMRSFSTPSSGASDDNRSSSVTSVATVSLPALACVDDLAGEAVLAACEKAVFGSPESTAAALAYAAHQITRLTSFGDVTTASRNMTPEIEALRRSVEHDRYGLMAQVLVVREHCTPTDCAVFKSLTDRGRISSNIEERTYDGLVGRYSLAWNAQPASVGAAVPPVAALIPGVPTGRPTNAEFPSAASTPPVSIMTAEPTTTSSHTAAAPAAAPSPSPRPAASASPAAAAAKKQAAPKPARTPAPATSLAPSAAPPAATPN